MEGNHGQEATSPERQETSPIRSNLPMSESESQSLGSEFDFKTRFEVDMAEYDRRAEARKEFPRVQLEAINAEIVVSLRVSKENRLKQKQEFERVLNGKAHEARLHMDYQVGKIQGQLG